MNPTERREAFCVIGAGPSGLTAAKNLLQQGIPCEVFEREDDVGGNWYYGRRSSSVYRSAHLISSKRLTEYTDFPMPVAYPPYPSHRQVLEYLRSYARQFDLYPHIRFKTTVRRVQRTGAGWHVEFEGMHEPVDYAGLVVANGHHWDPLWPEWPGVFAGEQIHARDYKSPDQLAGRRVLVVGGGNSGCDIAVEAAQHAATTFLSLRRGYHFLPKFLLGKPIDECGDRLHRLGLPLSVRRAIGRFTNRIVLGPPQNFGLPAPDHKLFESHPIVNSQLLYYAGHGDVAIRPDIERLCGDRVRFVDGREESVDLIIAATGYRISFPFLDANAILDSAGRPQLMLNAFHPQWDDLFIAGLIQPDSGQWGLTDLQAQVMAAFWTAVQQDSSAADWFREQRQTTRPAAPRGRFLDSPRHVLEVDYYDYRRRLRQLLRGFARRGIRLRPWKRA